VEPLPIQGNILAVHVRRGDFINEKFTHVCLSAVWYTKAIRLALELNPEIERVLIFNNDPQWVQINANQFFNGVALPYEIREFNPSEDPASNFLEFANYKYRVCSNSTFSLLASYIVPGKTIVPFPYNRSGNFKALEGSSPVHWVRIPSIWED
jgi:hypothetical protein